MNSKRIAGAICATAFLSIIGLLATSSHSAPADNAPCEGCGPEKIRVDLTGDPDIDRARWAKAFAAAKVVMQKNLDKSYARRLAKMNEWHGTKLAVKEAVTDADTIALHDAVCQSFSADPPAPGPRKAAVQNLMPAGSGHCCVGYFGSVESVTQNDNGWLAVVRVSPRLMSTKAAVLYSDLALVEEWQIGKDGSLQNVSCKADPKTGGLMGD